MVAYKVSRKTAQLITATFKMAYELRKPEAGLIFHSDCGAQYTSHRFQQLLHEQKCIQSFSILENLTIMLWLRLSLHP
ncbi:DDE-type integrase/transposase/recombinase [Oscillibacter sp.]|uniref:DDE-type integrase/transposase/recombinase n=1 Tax=Oscillibacter sp. TaxID=1945593 RepID=UPI00338F8E05